MFVAPRLRGVVPFATRLISLSSVTMATNHMFPSQHTLATTQRHLATTGWSANYTIEEFGTKYTDNYSAYIRTENGIVSPFHDVPFIADYDNYIFNMVVEIPRWSNAKMEISTKHRMNPIRQDVKKGKVRFVANAFPYKGYIWNYGAVPQTWENPNEADRHTEQMGDGDPIDIIDIGYKVTDLGVVKPVKVLGVLGLVDDGETDWKVIAIDINDPLADRLNEITDVPRVMPGILGATRDWFATYKMPGSDTPPNKFVFDGSFKGKDFAREIIMDTHAQWKKLIYENIENVDNLSCATITVQMSPYKIGAEDADAVREGLPARTEPAALPEDVDMMYYLTEDQKQKPRLGEKIIE